MNILRIHFPFCWKRIDFRGHFWKKKNCYKVAKSPSYGARKILPQPSSTNVNTCELSVLVVLLGLSFLTYKMGIIAGEDEMRWYM